MTRTARIASIVLALGAAIALIVAGGLAIGFAQTATLLAIATTLVMFCLLVRVSMI